MSKQMRMNIQINKKQRNEQMMNMWMTKKHSFGNLNTVKALVSHILYNEVFRIEAQSISFSHP